MAQKTEVFRFFSKIWPDSGGPAKAGTFPRGVLGTHKKNKNKKKNLRAKEEGEGGRGGRRVRRLFRVRKVWERRERVEGVDSGRWWERMEVVV
jgi:hypothetical protein